jgi:hypothetical protein
VPDRIVCPLELVDSEPTLDAALSMARAFHAELLLVHVLTDLPPQAAPAEGFDWAALAARLEKVALQRLSQAVSFQEASGVSHDDARGERHSLSRDSEGRRRQATRA